MLNVAGGATWVSLHHGGGVGMGYSQHSGVVIVCDGSEAADRRLARVLWNDPGTRITSYNVCYTKLLRTRRRPTRSVPPTGTTNRR